MFEKKSRILLVAGLGILALTFLFYALLPIVMYQDLGEPPAFNVVNPNLMYQFEDLSVRYRESFEKHFGEPTRNNCAEALELGLEVYVGEGCWHCHSQLIRPVSNEEDRWGPVATTEAFQNAPQRPVTFGPRRIGPDLSRGGGRRSSDWHAVHFFKPTLVVVDSSMPEYPWLFEGSPDKPSRRGLALITYIQWLGSWLESYPYYEDYQPPGSAGEDLP